MDSWAAGGCARVAGPPRSGGGLGLHGYTQTFLCTTDELMEA